MYLIIVLLPLITYLFASFFGYLIGAWGVAVLTISTLILCFALSLFAFYEVMLFGGVVSIDFFEWFLFEGCSVKWGLFFDQVTVSMLLIVTLVSMVVHLYSFEYMGEDPHLGRFMTYLTLFTFFMLVLVTSPNYLQLFLGWEGVGLVSYLLVNFWHTRIQANKSALKAILVNRIGDFFFFFGIVTVLFLFNSLDYTTVFTLTPWMLDHTVFIMNYEINTLTLIGSLFFLGAVGKSAQLGLHTWLPDAMEGPTPVSALIHAATMVTAGVFLLLRSAPLIEFCPKLLTFMIIVGGLTALLGASIGMFQTDLKKVIAYSTCSQLGYMVLACGVSAYQISLYHLVNHAFFKALLFLSAGCIIHSMSNEQDMRKMGGLRNALPVAYVMVVIGSLAIMGFPFLTGFYSKDALLEVVFIEMTQSWIGVFGYFAAVGTAVLTAFYSFRLLYLVFFGTPFGSRVVFEKVHESGLLMLSALLVLGVFSVFGGYLLKDIFIGLGNNVWLNAFGPFQMKINLVEAEFLPYYIKLLPVALSILVAMITMLWYSLSFRVERNNTITPSSTISIRGEGILRIFYELKAFTLKKWYFDIVYNYFIVFKSMNFFYFIFKYVDRGLFEHIGPTGLLNYIYSF
ncbi:MAG TPA: NADH-quinone oxidoreductase subunit L, partial [Bacteroidia bacterium]|nr:NADH-quinone oxidoreductase subunit L [Bacteroidia bacterium]